MRLSRDYVLRYIWLDIRELQVHTTRQSWTDCDLGGKTFVSCYYKWWMCYVYGSLTRHLMKNNRVVTETSQIKFCLLPKKSKLCHSLNIHSAHDKLQRYTVTLSGKIQIWSDACNYWLDMNYVPSSKLVPVWRNVWMYLYTNMVQHLLDIHQSAVMNYCMLVPNYQLSSVFTWWYYWVQLR